MAVMTPKILELDKNWAFFFDIDGTLADIAPTPEEAHIPKSTLSDLLLLQKRTGVALISGRSLVSIDSLTCPAKFPAAAQHGLEIRLSDSEIFLTTQHADSINGLIEKIKLFQASHPGLLVECKGLNVAVHYRMRPDLAATVQSFLDSIIKGQEDKVCRQQGKMVDEIRLRGGNKGTAIEVFMRGAAFQNKVPVFAGDDLTDEDAHKVVNKLGGVSIHVGASSHIAQHCLPTPRALRAWLSEIVTLEMAET